MKNQRIAKLFLTTVLCLNIVGSSLPSSAVSAAPFDDTITLDAAAGDENTQNSADTASTEEVDESSSAQAGESVDNTDAPSEGSSEENNNNGDTNTDEAGDDTENASDNASTDSSDAENSASNTSESSDANTSDIENGNDNNSGEGSSDSSSSEEQSAEPASTENATSPEGEAVPGDSENTDETEDNGMQHFNFSDMIGRGLAPLMLVGLNDSGSSSYYETEGLTDIIDSVSVTVNGESVENATISTGDTLKFSFKLKKMGVNVPEQYKDTHGNIPFTVKDKVFEYAVDNSVFAVVGNMPTITVQVEDEDTHNKTDFATVEILTDKIRITIIDEIEEHIVSGVKFSYEMTINAENEKVKDKESFSFKVGATEYTVLLKEFQRIAPTMTASGKDESDEEVDWTVNITNNTVRPIVYENGYTFTTTIGEGHSYIDGSFKIGDVTPETAPTVSGNTITYVLSKEEAAADSKITFSTKPEVNFMKESFKANKGGVNNATLSISSNIKDSKEITKASASVNISKEFTQWVNKEGGVINDEGKASWEVTINTNGYALKELTMYDLITSDNKVMKLVGGKVKVDGVEQDVRTGDSSCDFMVDLGDIAGGQNQTIKVTYDTEIANYDDYIAENHTIPTNKAWISYKEPDGNGVGKTPEVDCKLTGTTVDTRAGIAKDFVSYDETTHEITWKVTANKNKRQLSDATIVDTASDKQKIVEIKDFSFDDSSSVRNDISITEDSNNTRWTVNLGDELKGHKVSFKVVTKITEDSLWSKNIPNGYLFKNNVVLNLSGTEKARADASYTLKKTFVTLTSTNYNYDTHTIDYTAELNGSNTAITNVVFSDDLDGINGIGVDFVKGTLKVNNAEYTNYTWNNGVLTVNGLDFADSDDKKTITFTAKVKDSTILGIENGKSKTIANSIKVTTAANSEGQTASCNNTVANRIITKDGSIVNGVANYIVKLNFGQFSLPAGTTIQDTLGASLVLDKKSVHLYEATVNASTGDLTADTSKEVGPDEATVSVARDGKKSVLSVRLNNETTKPYVLKYSATCEYPDENDCKNSVAIVGYTEAEGTTASKNYSYSAFGDGSGSTVRRFILYVKDKETGSPISDAEYEVYKNTTDTEPIDKLKTKSGKDILVNVLEDGTYYLKQVKESVPDGYVTTDEFIEVTVNGKKVEHTEELEKVKVPVYVNVCELTEGNPGIRNAKIEVKRNDSNEKLIDNKETTGTRIEVPVYYDKLYTFTETKIPTGYIDTDPDVKPVIFKVTKENGEDVLYVSEDGVNFSKSTSHDTVIIYNKKADHEVITINTVTEKQETPVEGSKYNIVDHDTNDPIVKDWDPSEHDNKIELPKGKIYDIIETTPAKGIKPAPSGDNRITIDLTNDDITPEKKEIKIVRKIDPTVLASVTFRNVDKNEQTKELDGKVDVYTPNVENTITVRELNPEDVSEGLFDKIKEALEPNDDTRTKTEVTYQTVYIAKQTTVPEGYQPADDIIFTVYPDKTYNDKYYVSVYNRSSFVPTNSTVITFLNEKIPETPSNVTPEQKNENVPEQPTEDPTVQPTANPSDQPSNNAVTPSEDPGNNSGTDDTKDNKKDKKDKKKDKNSKKDKDNKNNNVTDNSQNTSDSQENGNNTDAQPSDPNAITNDPSTTDASNSAVTEPDVATESAEDPALAGDKKEGETKGTRTSLAKTGGFFGTVFAYLAGIALILAGALIVFKKKKKK